MSHKSKGTQLYGWQYTGQQRPDFADEPKPGEESVWDYPRPPAIVDDHRVVRVLAFDGTVLAESNISKRVLETASPPTFYLPVEALQTNLAPVAGSSFCEWKGQAEYFAFSDWRGVMPNPPKLLQSSRDGFLFIPPNVNALLQDRMFGHRLVVFTADGLPMRS